MFRSYSVPRLRHDTAGFLSKIVKYSIWGCRINGDLSLRAPFQSHRIFVTPLYSTTQRLTSPHLSSTTRDTYIYYANEIMKRNMQSTKSKNSSSILESASKSASKNHGREQLDTDTRYRLRSVLSDPLGIPLLCQLHGKDPSKLPHLGKTSVFLSDDHDHESRSPHVHNISSYDNILEKACNKWIEIDGFPEKNAEPALTSLLVEQIDEIMKDECTVGHGHQQHIPIPANDDNPKGQMDIYFEDSDDVALAVVEVGLDCQDWWANLDQILNYVEMMVINKGITCEKSVLLAVLTLDFDCKNNNNAPPH